MPTWGKDPTKISLVRRLFCIENLLCILFKGSGEKVAQCDGTEVRCGREVKQTVVALLSVRLADGERWLTVSCEVEQRSLVA